MVNDTSSPASAREAERALALGYATAGDWPALAALFALDARLGAIVRATREPMIGQMRLTWWYEALAALRPEAAPAEPLLQALATTVLPRGITGGELAALVEGWELLLDGDAPDAAALLGFGAARGGRLFGLSTRLLGAPDAVEAVGEGWALADLAVHWSDPATAGRAADLARARLERRRRWSRQGRPLGALALLAADDLRGGSPGSPRRIARLLVRRLIGW